MNERVRETKEGSVPLIFAIFRDGSFENFVLCVLEATMSLLVNFKIRHLVTFHTPGMKVISMHTIIRNAKKPTSFDDCPNHDSSC